MTTNTGLWVLQSPDETRQWEIDWSLELTGDEVVTQSIWSSLGDDYILITEDSIDTAGRSTFGVVDGSSMQLGKSYQVRNIVTTSKDRIMSREVTIRCNHK